MRVKRKLFVAIFVSFIIGVLSLSSAVFAQVPDIKANTSDGPVAITPEAALSITVALDPGSSAGQAADWWAYVTTPSGTKYWYTLDSGWQQSNTPISVYGGPLFSLATYELSTFTSLETGDNVFTLAVDDNNDGEQDDTYSDSVTVTVKPDAVSFKNDIAPLFKSGDGKGAWFNYGNSDIGGGWEGPTTACGVCHAGDVNGDGEEACPPECHMMDLNTHAGWLAGADGGTEPLLGEGTVGNTTYDWSHAKLRKRLRNNRMPPGIPFNIDEANRNGGDVVLSVAADGNDIALGGQFSVSVAGTSGYGEVVYGGDNSAVGLLETYVGNIGNATPATYAGSADPVVFADVAGLFTAANVWYSGGLACTACHYCDTEPPCFHMIDFNSEAGLLAGADAGDEPLLGESAVGDTDYNWGESGLRARLRNNRMPPNAAFDVNELTRMGPVSAHPVTGVDISAVNLIGEWVIGKDGIAGTADDALDN